MVTDPSMWNFLFSSVKSYELLNPLLLLQWQWFLFTYLSNQCTVRLIQTRAACNLCLFSPCGSPYWSLHWHPLYAQYTLSDRDTQINQTRRKHWCKIGTFRRGGLVLSGGWTRLQSDMTLKNEGFTGAKKGESVFLGQKVEDQMHEVVKV